MDTTCNVFIYFFSSLNINFAVTVMCQDKDLLLKLKQ